MSKILLERHLYVRGFKRTDMAQVDSGCGPDFRYATAVFHSSINCASSLLVDGQEITLY